MSDLDPSEIRRRRLERLTRPNSGGAIPSPADSFPISSNNTSSALASLNVAATSPTLETQPPIGSSDVPMYEAAQTSDSACSNPILSTSSSVPLSPAELELRPTYPKPHFLQNKNYDDGERSIPNLLFAPHPPFSSPPVDDVPDSEFADARDTFQDDEYRDPAELQSISLDGHVLGGSIQGPAVTLESSTSTVSQGPTQPQIPDREARINFLQRFAPVSRPQAQTTSAAASDAATVPKELSNTASKQSPASKTYSTLTNAFF